MGISKFAIQLTLYVMHTFCTHSGKDCQYILQVQPEERWLHWSGGLQ